MDLTYPKAWTWRLPLCPLFSLGNVVHVIHSFFGGGGGGGGAYWKGAQFNIFSLKGDANLKGEGCLFEAEY